MTASLRLGRIAGIPIGASWSVLLIAALIAWSLAGTILPAQVQGLDPAAAWLAGGVGAGLFLASLLAHELGHALVARRAGLRVRGITLWLLGGVAQLEQEPASPRDELRVAAVGPAVSLALAAAFALAAAAVGLAGGPEVAVALAAWLAVINTGLALFNLLPAAPLDGGRVLRGLLWRRRGDRLGATVTATRAGQLLGAGLIAYGLLGTVAGWGAGTLWTALVGWFLTIAARQERDHALAGQRLGRLRAADVMTPVPASVPAWFSVDAVLRNYVEPWRPAALALHTFEGQPAGVATTAALRAVPPARRHLVRAAEVALAPSAVLVVGPDDPAATLAARLGDRPVAAVVDRGRLVGLVTTTELHRAGVRAPQGPAAAA